MAETTEIAWCDATFNPWRGCTKVSPGCTNCYAEAMSHRNPKVLGEWGPNGARVIASEPYWRQPLKWDREARAAGERRRVFCASLADVFEERPELIVPRQRLFQLIGRTPNLDWLLLTKRPEVAVENWPLWAGYWASSRDAETIQKVGETFILPNVWLGVSVEDQARADERIPLLLQVPAAVRFLSVEPLLGPIDLSECLGLNVRCSPFPDSSGNVDIPSGSFVDWVIVGGESGHDARPCRVEWVRSIVDQCRAAGAPCFVKQDSGPYPGRQGRIPDDLWAVKEALQ